MPFLKKFIYPVLLIVLCSCTTHKPIKNETINIPKPPEIEPLIDYFDKCDKEIIASVKVIRDEEIIKNLTHLRLMNYGGQKYYLLEKENITSMIKSLTTIEYTDCFLINHSGVIIYTMYSESYFGKNIKQSYPGQPISKCLDNYRKPGLFIIDIDTQMTDKKTIYLSYPVWKNNEFHGVFVLLIDLSSLKNIYTDDTFVIGKEGRYRIIKDNTQLFNLYDGYNNVKIGKPFNYNDQELDCKIFNFKNLEWFIITPHHLQSPQ